MTRPKPSQICHRCKAKWAQDQGLCRRCAQAVQARHPGGRAAFVNDRTALQQPGRGEAKRSWWTTATRESFTAQAQQEQSRMSRSAMAQAVSGYGGMSEPRT